MFRKRRPLVVVCLVALALFVAACGSSSKVSSVASSATAGASTASSTSSAGHLPTAKFVLHAGLAFGAFHHFIYKPYKAGDFKGGLLKHKVTTLKAALAGLFAYHELKLAANDAKASPLLSKLTKPITDLADKFKSIGSSVKSGHPNAASIESTNSGITSLSGLAKGAGISVPDRIPSTGQLASGA